MLILADRRRNPGRLPASRAGCCQPEDSQSATGSLFSRSRLGNSIPRDHEELGLGGGKSCGPLLPRSSRAANDGRTVLRTFPSWAVNCLMLGQRNPGTSTSNTITRCPKPLSLFPWATSPGSVARKQRLLHTWLPSRGRLARRNQSLSLENFDHIASAAWPVQPTPWVPPH
jgi:hypothetical protein